MDSIILPNETWLHIFKGISLRDLLSLLLSLKKMTEIINGKTILSFMNDFRNIAYSSQINNFLHIISEITLALILKDKEVDIRNLTYMQYKPTNSNKKLLLKSIICNNVNKTILLLKFFGNQHIYYNKSYIGCFERQFIELMYHLSRCGETDLFLKINYLNLHFVFMILFSSFDFLKQVLPYMKLSTENLCYFSSQKTDVIDWRDVKSIAESSFKVLGVGHCSNFSRLIDVCKDKQIVKKIKYLTKLYPYHVNFAWFSPQRMYVSQPVE